MILFYSSLFYIFWLISLSILISNTYMRIISYYITSIIFLLAFFMIVYYNKSIIWYQILFRFYNIYPYYINNIIGIDGFSILFIFLCVCLLSHCLLIYWYLRYKINLYCILVLFILWLLINLFSSLDLVLFYIYFEAIAIPTFLLIGIWGSRNRKIYAAYQFFIYTLLGSVFLLIGVLSILYNKGTSSIDLFLNSYFFTNRQLILWCLCLLVFLWKYLLCLYIFDYLRHM